MMKKYWYVWVALVLLAVYFYGFKADPATPAAAATTPPAAS